MLLCKHCLSLALGELTSFKSATSFSARDRVTRDLGKLSGTLGKIINSPHN